MSNKCNKKDLAMISTSLFYLSNEAERSDLKEVSVIIVEAINKIEEWSKGNLSIDLSKEIINKETISMLTLFLKFSEMPLDRRADAIEYLLRAEDDPGQRAVLL